MNWLNGMDPLPIPLGAERIFNSWSKVARKYALSASMKWWAAFWLLAGLSQSHSVADTQFVYHQTADDARMQEARSWGLFSRNRYVPPSIQPEPPRLFLKRMKPRLDHDESIERLVGEIRRVTIPAFDFRDARAGTIFDRINELIRIHNKQNKAFPIPPVALDIITDFKDPEHSLEEPERSPTDFSPLNSRVSLTLSQCSLWDVMNYVSEIENLSIVPEPNGLWLVNQSTGGIQELIRRSYLVPKSVFSDSEQADAALQKTGLFGTYTVNTWEFDPKSQVFTLRAGYQLDAFELWYAHELLKHGYSLPPSKPEAASARRSNSVPDPQVPGYDDLQRLTGDASATMDIVCASGGSLGYRLKLEGLRRLVRSLCRIDQWMQRYPRLPDTAMAPPDPPEGLPQGADPSAVKEPVARKAYANAVANATLISKLITDRINAEFLYKQELDYTYLLLDQWFDESEIDAIISAIDDATKGQNLRDKAKADMQSLAKEVQRNKSAGGASAVGP